MEAIDKELTVLLPHEESELRISRVRGQMLAAADSPRALLLGGCANIYYLTGRVFAGWIYIPLEGPVIYFVKRPVTLRGDNTVMVRKPEEIPATIGLGVPESLGLELDLASWSCVNRLKALFPEARLCNASAVMRAARAVKTPFEIEKIRRSGVDHMRVYSRIPRLFRPGMTDIELQIEIERVSRLEGSLGQFRVSGDSMEIFMGSLLAGANADAASPYDFALGGEGLDPSLPVGANDSEILPGTTVMVDLGGDFTGYMTDMSRVYSFGKIPQRVLEAHQCSIDIHRALAKEAVPGVPASKLWETAMEIVKERGLEHHFMGHRQHAGFLGHGVGIDINELPVIAPRSRDILQEGNVIALEPKFVFPETGAVGIENTYHVTPAGLECLTPAPEEIIPLDL